MTLRIHPLVDRPVPASPPAARATLRCDCVDDPVVVSVEASADHAHLCGCSSCWRPPDALFAAVGLVPRSSIAVVAGDRKLRVVRPDAPIQRYACTECRVHLFGGVENAAMPLHGTAFVNADRADPPRWAVPTFAAFVSRVLEGRRVAREQMPALRARLRELRIEAYDSLSPALMDEISAHYAERRHLI